MTLQHSMRYKGLLQYFTIPPHSTWNMFHHINHVLTDMDSTWNPCGINIDSMWNAPNISTYFQVRFKKLISYKTFDQLTT